MLMDLKIFDRIFKGLILMWLTAVLQEVVGLHAIGHNPIIGYIDRRLYNFFAVYFLFKLVQCRSVIPFDFHKHFMPVRRIYSPFGYPVRSSLLFVFAERHCDICICAWYIFFKQKSNNLRRFVIICKIRIYYKQYQICH